MSDTHHQINLALRTAAGHARAANDAITAADRTYEMKMKSAGASMWEAWGLAVRSQSEYAGRKIDDKALARIYESTKARPWWDSHLSAVKVEGKQATREWAKRTLQWHTDPDAARVRNARRVAASAASRREIKEKAAAQGPRRPQAGSAAPSTAEMREMAKAVPAYKQEYQAASGYAVPRPTDEAIRLLARMRHMIDAMTTDIQLAEAEAMLRLAAEGLEAL